MFYDKYKENVVHGESLDEVVDVHIILALNHGSKISGVQLRERYHVNLTNEDVTRSLSYLYKKGSEEVKKFNKTDFIKRIAIEKDGVLLSKSRILDSQRFQVAGGLDAENILGTGQFGINVVTPVLAFELFYW